MFKIFLIFLLFRNIKKNQNKNYHKKGFDQRKFEKEEIPIEKIKSNFIKFDLLKDLKNEDISVVDKLELIENYNKIFEYNKYLLNIKAGLHDEFSKL